MAPVLSLLTQLFPTIAVYASLAKGHAFDGKTPQQQHPIIDDSYADENEYHTTAAGLGAVSSVSWGVNRTDAFTVAGSRLTHKFWDGYQWNPSGKDLELLGNGMASQPVAVTWGVDRLDIFGLNSENEIIHQYWDGIAWRPDVSSFETLGGKCDGAYPIAANTWGPNRLDIFCTGTKGDLLHQYYDGSQWQPSVSTLETFGGNLATGPSVISWAENRLDIFAVDPLGDVVHIYWDGHQWSGWEVFPFTTHFTKAPLAVSSWGENRMDIWGVGLDNAMWHRFWDGYQWSGFEELGGGNMKGSVSATSWGVNRHDIVCRAGYPDDDTSYWYKYWDGTAWQPSVNGWYDKGQATKFRSDPSVNSWGENRLDIYGENAEGELLHQTWYGSGWYPESTVWEVLGEKAALVEEDGVEGFFESELRK